MDERRPSIKTVRDVGYRVIMRSEDGSPRKVWRCLIKEGSYGKFISIEQHWILRMEGNRIAESEWAKKSFNFPYDKERAFATWNSVKELIVEALGAGAAELENEEEEELGDEYERYEKES